MTTDQPKHDRRDTLAGAIHRKCNCLRCRAHCAALRRDIFAQKAAGTWQPFVDPAPVLAHVEELHAEGMSYRHIARLARVDVDVIHRMRGKSKNQPPSQQIRAENATRLLALQLQFTRQARSARMPNRGALRRVQALRAIGWPMYALVEKSGLGSATLIGMSRAAWVEMGTQRAIEALYELLRDQDPAAHGISADTVRRTKRHAAKQRWAVPSAWTDIDTDDEPNRLIRRMDYQPAPAQRSHAEIVAETKHLASYGLTRAQVVEHIGLQWASIVAAHTRGGVELPVRLQQEHASEAGSPERKAA